MLKTRLMEPADPRSAATHTPMSEVAAAVLKPAGRAPSSGEDARERFERLRLAAFARRGFAGEIRRIPDRAGGESYALVSGDGPCPTVLVHGGVGNTVEWAEIAARLDGPVVIPDRPGFGLSHPHNYRRVDFRADAERWLLGLADGLGEEQIDLVGNSMGGFFAIAFAAAHPERVRRLILSGSSAGLFPRIGLFLHLWATPGIGALISQIKFRDIETLRKRAFGSYLVHPDRLPTDLLEVALAGVNLPGTAETNRAILQNLITFRGWRPEMRLDDRLAAVEVPVLFVWGAKDQLAPADVARDIAERMSDAKLAVIEDAGHIPHLDQPEAVTTAINGFLRKSESHARAVATGFDAP
jgi:pimeloyl-ACP methyl ester carboxylesterase